MWEEEEIGAGSLGYGGSVSDVPLINGAGFPRGSCLHSGGKWVWGAPGFPGTH
jgi:hypothetical protein